MKTPVAVIAALGLIVFSGAAQNAPAKQRQSAELIDSLRGANLFKAYCAVCHGPEANGNGPMAKALRSAPADLRRIAARNGGVFPAARVRRVISGEEILTSGHGTREMPVWGPIFSQVGEDRDMGLVRIDNLARYIESLQIK